MELLYKAKPEPCNFLLVILKIARNAASFGALMWKSYCGRVAMETDSPITDDVDSESLSCVSAITVFNCLSIVALSASWSNVPCLAVLTGWSRVPCCSVLTGWSDVPCFAALTGTVS